MVDISLTDVNDMLTEGSGIGRAKSLVLNALQSLLCSSWSRLMARVAILARRFELWAWMVREDVGCLAIREAVLTIGYQMARYALHVVHLAKTAHRILDEEELGLQFADEFEGVLVHLVGKCGFLGLRVERTRHGVLHPMMSDSSHAECRTIVAAPNDVRPSEVGQNLLGSQLHDVDVER